MVENVALQNGYRYHCCYCHAPDEDFLSGYYKISDISEWNYSYGQYRMDVKDMLFKTVEEAIKHLNSTRRRCILPDGSVIIPEEVNYPGMSYNNVFQPWHPGVRELWPGEY